MKRRGFLQRIFGSDAPVRSAFLGIELVIREYALPDLRAKLHDIIDAPWADGRTPSADERRIMYRKLVMLLAKALPHQDYGYWEYETRERDAAEGFHRWVSELEHEISDETEDDEEETERVLVEKTYVVVSLAFLTRFAVPIGDEYDDEDPASWRRRTFADLLGSIEFFDFQHVQADAAFVLPGSDDDGLSEVDLATEEWEHLRALDD